MSSVLGIALISRRGYSSPAPKVSTCYSTCYSVLLKCSRRAK